MRIASIVTALGLAAAAFTLPAAAQTPGGWYLGFKSGQSKYNFNCSGTCDDKGAAYGFFAGVGLHPNIALEGGWTDLGRTTFGNCSGPNTAGCNLRAQVWELSGLGSWWFGPAQKFGVYGRLGVYNGDLKQNTPSTGAETKHGNTDLTFGIGGAYNLSRRFTGRLEWQRYSKMGGGGFGVKDDVDLFNIALLYKF
jgi:OOP family OmpA-OmpF porin